MTIVFVILIVCIQQVDGLLIGPRIIGGTTGLKPVWVVFSITVGGALFGVIGMFLGVPVFAVLSYLLNITVQHFLEKRNFYQSYIFLGGYFFERLIHILQRFL